MKTLVSKAFGPVLLLVVLTIGCAKAGSEYVGRWVSTSNSMDTLNITRNGDQFQITGGNQQTMNVTYTKDGKLEMSSIPGMDLTLTYIKSSDTLQAPAIIGATVYKRVK